MRTLARGLMRNFIHSWSGDAVITVVLRYAGSGSGYNPTTGKPIDDHQDSMPLKTIPLTITDEDRFKYGIQSSSRKLVFATQDLPALPDATTSVLVGTAEYVIEKVAVSSLDAMTTVFVKGL